MNLLEYRSIADMNRLILENLYKLSHDKMIGISYTDVIFTALGHNNDYRYARA